MQFDNFNFRFSIRSPKDAELNFRPDPLEQIWVLAPHVCEKSNLVLLGRKMLARIVTVKDGTKI